VVELPVSVAAKVLLLNEMLRQKVRPIELARRIGVTKQEVNRLTDLKHATKIDRIDAALRALGKRLVLDAA
jgi:antitoxin HicB